MARQFNHSCWVFASSCNTLSEASNRRLGGTIPRKARSSSTTLIIIQIYYHKPFNLTFVNHQSFISTIRKKISLFCQSCLSSISYVAPIEANNTLRMPDPPLYEQDRETLCPPKISSASYATKTISKLQCMPGCRHLCALIAFNCPCMSLPCWRNSSDPRSRQRRAAIFAFVCWLVSSSPS